jgi:cytochrome P450
MQPIIPAVFRKVVSPIIIGEKNIPVGWNMCICTSDTIERASTFLDDSPKSFAAERFIKMQPDGLEYCPFGAGVRRCPGQEAAKLEVSMLLGLVALKGGLVPVGEALPAVWDVDPVPTPRPGLVFYFLPTKKSGVSTC